MSKITAKARKQVYRLSITQVTSVTLENERVSRIIVHPVKWIQPSVSWHIFSSCLSGTLSYLKSMFSKVKQHLPFMVSSFLRAQPSAQCPITMSIFSENISQVSVCCLVIYYLGINVCAYKYRDTHTFVCAHIYMHVYIYVLIKELMKEVYM